MDHLLDPNQSRQVWESGLGVCESLAIRQASEALKVVMNLPE